MVEEIAHAQPGIDNRKALGRGEWRLRYIALFLPLLINSNFVLSDCNEFIGIRHLLDVRQQIRTNVGLDFSAGEGRGKLFSMWHVSRKLDRPVASIVQSLRGDSG